MDVNAVSRNAQALPAAAMAITPDKAAENRQVVQAVKAINQSELFGQDNSVVFQRDPDTQRMVVKVINLQTNDVIEQIPPEYVLRLAEDLKPKSANGATS